MTQGGVGGALPAPLKYSPVVCGVCSSKHPTYCTSTYGLVKVGMVVDLPSPLHTPATLSFCREAAKMIVLRESKCPFAE